MNIKELTSETSYVLDSVAPAMPCEAVGSLVQKYQKSPRRRHRYCFHQNPNVDLHDIIICYDSTSYIPPNKHIDKIESLLVIDGELDFFLFNDLGQVYDYRRLGPSDSTYPFYVRVPSNTWHGLRAVGTKPCVIKETIAGPYDLLSLRWASFAPNESEGNIIGNSWYDEILEQCIRKGICSPADEVYEQITDTVFRSTRQLVTVSLKQLQPIIIEAESTSLKRARLCCHDGPQDKLQEMFIALASGVNIEESFHLRKDESLTVIGGNGRYIFPNEDGTIRKEISLNSYGDPEDIQGNFFARINRYVPHKIIIEKSYLLIHEATSGPFLKSDTDYRIKGVN